MVKAQKLTLARANVSPASVPRFAECAAGF
jgi:hypothetical protein